MTTAQLLRHIPDACGACMRGFVTGDWGMPADAGPDEMLPSAEKMPSVKSVPEAEKLLAADKRVALDMIKKAGEKDDRRIARSRRKKGLPPETERDRAEAEFGQIATGNVQE